MKLQEAICLVGNNFLRQQEEPASLEKLGERPYMFRRSDMCAAFIENSHRSTISSL